jgi:hypothetical protein
MKILFAAAAAALVVCPLASTPARASIQFADAGNTVVLHDGAGGNGGIFYVDVIGKVSNTSPYNGSATYYDFPTFCVEIGEHIVLGNSYTVASITTASKETGYNLGSFAAWLYTQFLTPILSGVPASGIESLAKWGDNATQDANAIQVGIWKSMGYTPTDISGALSGGYDSDLLDDLHAAYQADLWSYGVEDPNTWNAGTYYGNIRIMNLETPSGGTAQDQLVWVPGTFNPPPPQVPEPLSAVVWSLLAMCTGSGMLARRRAAQ